jgi:hypothetical protein
MSREPDLAKRAAWQLRLREFDRGKDTVGEFCRRAGVSVAAFYQWRRKLTPASVPGRVTAAAAKSPSSGVASGRVVKPLNFLPVEIAARAGIEVLLPSGTRLTIPCHDHEAIRTVMATLLNATPPSRPEDRAC